MTQAPTTAPLEPAERLSRDLRAAAATLTHREARYLVDAYYQMQDNRIRGDNQRRALAKEGEPHDIVEWFAVQARTLENQVKGALARYADAHTVGVWLQSITGIGPVIAAGLLAHIDITRAPTAGAVWRYAGLDPTSKWEKGEKRPWNASLKTLCWKAGESFVKVQANESDVYGKVYAERKELEVARNERGDFADQAARVLQEKRIRRSTDAFGHYSEGRLPPAHVHARAKRYAVKLFLAHLHHVMHEDHFGAPPPKPYIIEHGGHTHFIAPPNWPME